MITDRLGVSHFYHTDGLGSIVDLTDNAGVVAQSYVYDSFGNIVSQVEAIENPYTYTGREFDEESGLYFYRRRYYDPSLGRFLQEDPIGLVGGLNLYSYTVNNPINFIDSEGTVPGLIIFAAVLLLAALFGGIILSLVKAIKPKVSQLDKLKKERRIALDCGDIKEVEKLNKQIKKLQQQGTKQVEVVALVASEVVPVAEGKQAILQKLLNLLIKALMAD